MVRLIATDLDGTLLGRGGQVTERTLDAIARFAGRGGVFVPVTGRSAPHIPPWIRTSEHIRYCLHSNGGRCEEVRTGDTVFVNRIPSELCVEAFRVLEPWAAHWNVFADGMAFSEFHRAGAGSELVNLLRRVDLTVEKLDVTPEDKADRARAWDVLCRIEGLDISSAYDTNIEINTPEGAKGRGVERLAALLGIRREEIMAFGDGLNDLSLLSCAGLPVAMENAVPELKAAARFIAPSNIEDGEAACIERFALP